MVLGTVLILAALSLFLWNRREERQAGDSAQVLMPRLIQRIEAAEDGGTEPLYPDLYDPHMTETEIDGYAYIGYLSIPAENLQLPVMSEWDYDRLKIAPCRYAGSTKTGDLVIAAHNYARHFGSVSKLPVGEQVYFTDMDGVLSVYEVAAVEVLAPTDIAGMTAGDYDLTLFTCTYDGQNRVTVRCERMQ